MKFTASHGVLRYVAGTLSQLGDVTISPERGSFSAMDYNHIRRLQYTPDMTDSTGSDASVDTTQMVKMARRLQNDITLSLSDESLVMDDGQIRYKLRRQEPVPFLDAPKTGEGGTITLPTNVFYNALADVAATGTSVIVISIRQGTALFHGPEGNSCDIMVPAQVTGRGYSRLLLNDLMECVPRIASMMATIHLSAREPATIKYGDEITYHQSAMLL